MTANGFAMLYRWTIEPGHECRFVERWKSTTEELRERYGGLGSCLTREAGGAYVAFARWPSREVRDRAMAQRAMPQRPAYVLAFTQTELTVEADMLLRMDGEGG